MACQLAALVVDEGKWLTASMGLALLAVTILLYRHRHADLSSRRHVLTTMSLFFGVTIGTMSFGHVLAVTTKLVLGTLEGSIMVFYLIGAALAVPSLWLILHARRVFAADDEHGRATLILNAWLAATVVVLGIHNLPLAATGLLNIGYYLHSRRVVGKAIVSLAVVANIGLFIGSLIFLASGKSFEEFRGMQ